MAIKVMDLIYWRDVGKTGLVVTGLVIGLASLFQLSSVTMLSYLCISIMCLTFPLRLYYKLLELIRKIPEGVHPFQSYIGDDSSLTDEETVLVVEEVVLMMAFAITEIKRLLFIDSIMDSIKFVVLLYVLTYMGITTNGLTLVIVGVICVFSLPLFYKQMQGRMKRISKAVRGLLTKIKNLFKMLYSKLRPSPATTSATTPTPTPAPKHKLKSK
ncbi:reticulon-1-A [Oncorhynchus tshawytscha]|uniref:Reticulon n=1 Tax=Oncorhynchus tshawytscha TaxID=74940 RepID=A0AAZ3R4P7_ONCTS|nr:reticulon-1-A [Oncorhynchus tshawytscha]